MKNAFLSARPSSIMPIGDPGGGEASQQEKGWLTGVHMAAVPVRDLDVAVEFYTERVGLRLRRRGGGWAELGNSEGQGFILLYVPRPGERRPGDGSGAMLSCDSIYDLHRRLVDEGVTFKLKPQRQPWGGLMAVFLDQDGNELMVLEGSDWGHSGGIRSDSINYNG